MSEDGFFSGVWAGMIVATVSSCVDGVRRDNHAESQAATRIGSGDALDGRRMASWPVAHKSAASVL